MKVIRSKVIGYCFGVSNTIEKAELCIDKAKEAGLPCYSIGQIIHNKDVVKNFTNRGMQVTEWSRGFEPGVALIRAHGIPDSLRRSYQEAGFILIDSTCPIVAKGASALRKAALNGKKTIIIGVKGHAETIGLQGVETSEGPVVSRLICSMEDAQDFVAGGEYSENDEIVVVVQTTFPEKEFNSIRRYLKTYFRNIRFSTTPCGATSSRIRAAKELSEQCDALFVIGGRNSENTKDLARALDETGKPVFCIENEHDLDDDLLEKIAGFSTIGICSGSSTPTSVIRAVEDILEKL
ncbi:MAG: 4-hydroxy-3-methylbut-2-enyl diphosphate reductase [Spirochaetales bacterium]|nr:4-hydroxy-3-methylbut-2-enyl diphosphate reductase [Spirochaetales bacterium]